MMNYSLFLLLISAAVASAAQKQPLVVLPPTIKWNTENTIIVTPNPNSYASRVDIKGQIIGSNGSFNDPTINFQFGKQNVNAGEPISLTVLVKNRADFYQVIVSVTDHSEFKMLVKGAPNIDSVFLQSDKTFYRSNETVKLRALPLTSSGNIFHGKLRYILQDPNGFEIRSLISKPANRFIEMEFTLPLYLRYGHWKVVAKAQKSDHPLGEVVFRVEDYVLPKFHVNVQVEDHNRPLYTVKVTVLAKFPRGNKVNGDLLLYCSLATERNSTSASNIPQPKRTLLLSGKIENGEWSQELSISQCVSDSNSRVEILAEVHEASTFKDESGSAFYEVRRPGFEIISNRPAVLRSTRKIVLYIRPIADDISIKESEILVNFCCISNKINDNGYQRNSTAYKLGGFLALDFDVNPECIVHLFKAYRKLSNDTLSREEIIAIPTLEDTSILKSYVESSDPAKFLYYEGDNFEAHVTSRVSDLNYVVLCDSKRVVASGKVPETNQISVPVRNGMNGICMLYVYKLETPKTKLDMLIFMTQTGLCPPNYQISVSNNNVAVNKEITLKMTAANNVLGLVRAMDSRLEKMFHSRSNPTRHYVFNFAEFIANDKEKVSPVLTGFITVPELVVEINAACWEGGRFIVSSSLRYAPGSSMVSNLCVTRIVASMLERYRAEFQKNNRMEMKDANAPGTTPNVRISGFVPPRATKPPPLRSPLFLLQQSEPSRDATRMNKAHENSDLMPTNDFDSDELFLRDFFPEVWIFRDFTFGQSAFVEERLVAPHSVAEWSFVSHFWAPAHRNVCKLPTLTVFTSRHLYIDVDLPKHVYENETVEFKLSVNADKQLDKPLSLALCIRGFSPLSCADLGPEGRTDENDYFGFTMDSSNLKVEKSFFVRYLRDGEYDLQFELLDRSTLLNTRWHCDSSGYAHVFDKIKHTIHVSKRVDVDEHFRQVVVHRQRQPANQPAIARITNMISLPDVIQFKDTAFSNGSSILTAGITSTERIFDISMEFSEFIPSMPLKDMNSFAVMRNSPRRRRQIASLGSLSDVIADLSLVTFQSKSKIGLQSTNEDMEESQQNEITVGNLLSELLTYSDCNSAEHPKACGFGEYGAPSSPEMRDIVLTSLATTLLCEQSAAEQYICGPITFLSEVIPQTSKGGFLEFMQFGEGRDSETFLRSLLSWVGKECSAYSCVRTRSVWKDFLSREYQAAFNSKDLRIEAAMAHFKPGGSASLARQNLADRADRTTLPFWSVKIKESSLHQSLLDTSIQRSADILLNSLVMLAFTETPEIYSFWRPEFDFDLLAEWLIAQQDGRHQFENALDTYFGLKALQAYRSCQLTASSNEQISVNVSSANQTLRAFNQDDLPLKLGVPTNSTHLKIASSGDLRMVLGVRVLTEKRRRSKRDPSENFPVSIKITQEREGSTAFFTQKVTITSHSSLLTKLEVEHGLMTGFTTDVGWIKLTSKGVSFLIEPRVRSSAVNFVISGLQRDKEFSYEIRIAEPTFTYSLDFLAPFLITAKHHVVVGRQVIFPKDLDFSQAEDFSRRKRFTAMTQRLQQSNLIETVCVENGACTCAEGSCDVICQSCRYIKVEDMCREFKRPFGFVIVFKLLTHKEVSLDGGTFDVFDVRVYESHGIDETHGEFSIWIRSCNTLCKRATRDANSRYLLIGRSDGIFYSPITHSNNTDTSALHRHYLLRNDDRLAKASDCWALFSEFQDSECINKSELL